MSLSYDYTNNIKKGDEICIGKESRCDLHPQCLGGEDEINCEEEYIKKGFFTERQIFQCPTPNHTLEKDGKSFTIFTKRAVRCDAVIECPGGEDEDDCNITEEAPYALCEYEM